MQDCLVRFRVDNQNPVPIFIERDLLLFCGNFRYRYRTRLNLRYVLTCSLAPLADCFFFGQPRKLQVSKSRIVGQRIIMVVPSTNVWATRIISACQSSRDVYIVRYWYRARRQQYCQSGHGIFSSPYIVLSLPVPFADDVQSDWNCLRHHITSFLFSVCRCRRWDIWTSLENLPILPATSQSKIIRISFLHGSVLKEHFNRSEALASVVFIYSRKWCHSICISLL